MIEIPLNGASGKIALVDEADATLVRQHKWYYAPQTTRGQRHPRTGYARAFLGRKSFSMHRLIMQPPAHLVVDHLNYNGLDNRRSNLRVCTTAENNARIRPYLRVGVRAGNFNGDRKPFGVERSECRGVVRYRAALNVQGKRHRGVWHNSEMMAALERDFLVLRHQTDHPILNYDRAVIDTVLELARDHQIQLQIL